MLQEPQTKDEMAGSARANMAVDDRFLAEPVSAMRTSPEAEALLSSKASGRLSRRASSHKTNERWEPRLPWDRPFGEAGVNATGNGRLKTAHAAEPVSEARMSGDSWAHLRWAGRRLRSGPLPRIRPPLST